MRHVIPKILSESGIDEASIHPLMAAARNSYERGWAFGTSGNYSRVHTREPLRLLITASGRDKGMLRLEDFTLVNEQGVSVESALPDPSAETLLHVMLARDGGAGAVLHTHSVWGTLLSEHFARAGGFALEGYEMLKGFDGIRTHEARKWVEIFENSQDIAKLAESVRTRIIDAGNPLRPGFLIAGHGLYAWGRDVDEARRHVEVFEFLFEVVGRKLSLPAMASPIDGEAAVGTGK